MTRVLFITAGDPEYLNGGATIRDHYLVDGLSKRHSVVLVCPRSPAESPAYASLDLESRLTIAPSRPMTAALRGLLPRRLYHAELRLSPEPKTVKKIESMGPFDYVWSSMLYPMAGIISRSRLLTSASLIWDTHNDDRSVFSGFVTAGGARGAYARTQLGAIDYWMRWGADRAEAVVACTTQDQKSIAAGTGRGDAVVASNGVATSMWLGKGQHRRHPFRFVIFGSLFPSGNTSRGALHLLAKVWPELLTRFPNSSLTVAGSGPSENLRNAVGRAAGAQLVADPEDMPELVQGHTHILVPQYAGHGSKIKMFESLASGLPVVATQQACVGLDIRTRGLVTVVNSDVDWAGAIARAGVSDQDCKARQGLALSFDWANTLAPAMELLEV